MQLVRFSCAAPGRRGVAQTLRTQRTALQGRQGRERSRRQAIQVSKFA